ncbi:MAG: aldose 1-epimerase [Pseudomonadota bacterium]
MSGDTTAHLGDWELVARPALGGALVACRYRGVDILRDARSSDHVTQTAAYPLVPFCGRIEQGTFQWRGHTVHLAPNFLPEPHAIHGTGWTSIWGAEVTADGLSLSMFNDIGWWPWPFLAKQMFEADGPCLSLTMSLTNTGETAMPAGLGWHPFFPAQGATLSAGTASIWAGAPDTHPQPPSAEQDLGRGRPAESLDIDHCYDWPGRWARLSYDHGRPGVELRSQPLAQFLTVYHPPGADFICAEPLTHVPNALNLPHAPEMAVLEPCETLSMIAHLDIAENS